MKLAVVGPGLIGRSVTLAARHGFPDCDIVEIDRGDALEGARGADIIVLAAPVAVILEIIQSHADLLRPALAIDTGSTKRQVLAAARLARLPHFVGGHPMAGAATAGAAGARADLFHRRPWFLAPADAATDAGARAGRFVEALGAEPVWLDDDGAEHDRVMAAVSHLPQVVASMLMVVSGEAAAGRLSWAGNGLRDTTRLAASSAGVWESVLSSNAESLAPLVRQIGEQLIRLAPSLHDPSAIRDLFGRANAARAALDDAAPGKAS